MTGRNGGTLTKLGTVLVLLGVSVWIVYAVLRWGLGLDVDVSDALPFHLAGVVPGSLLRHRRWFLRLLRRSSRDA